MHPAGSLSCAQDPIIGPYSKPVETSANIHNFMPYSLGQNSFCFSVA